MFPAIPESEGAEAIQATSRAVIWDWNREPGRAMSTVAGPAYPTTIPNRTMYREEEKAAKYISFPLFDVGLGRSGLSSGPICKTRSSLYRNNSFSSRWVYVCSMLNNKRQIVIVTQGKKLFFISVMAAMFTTS